MPIVGFKKIKVVGNSCQGGAFYGVFESQSWSGGAFYGVFEGQSWSGGASVSGVSFHIAYGNSGAIFGVYCRCTSYPASTTTIYDADSGANGYERCSISSTGHVVTEFKNAGVSYTFDLGVLPLSQWCWISTATAINIADNNALICKSSMYNGSGALLSTDSTSVLNMATNRDTAFTAILSVGLPGSGSYSSAPNNGTMKFSKLRHANASGVAFPFTPPSGDTSGDINDYMARQTVGTAATLTDTGSAAQTMTAGGQGLTINLDGPYP